MNLATIVTSVVTDERSWQNNFYDAIFGADKDKYLRVDRCTDGYTDGILFEHKPNVTSCGHNKALLQALIYLCRFNRDGVPVPAKICLVSQDEQKCYVYDTSDYMAIVEDIETYANMKASDGIAGFAAGKPVQVIKFDKNLTARGLAAIDAFISQMSQTVKVHITAHNVYGWSGYYYGHAAQYKQKPEKKAFFKELRNPAGALKNRIEPWTGDETDFKYIMDMLNDPMTQRKLGAFYTPPPYAELAAGLVRKAIERAMAAGKKDYIILDRCAGTGNLEMHFTDEELSHVIVSTYELKEWMVLKDRFGSRVRCIIPPIPVVRNALPGLNTDGFLSGANALTRDILDNDDVMRHVRDPDCAVILLENPPFVELKGAGEHNQTADVAMKAEMRAAGCGNAVNDLCNIFIWSGFKHFLRHDSDSYIVFSPIKYWKFQNLVQKKFVAGYAFNRIHFHAKTKACITRICWSNEDDSVTSEIDLDAVDLDGQDKMPEGKIAVRKIRTIFSDAFYDKRSDPADTKDGIVLDNDGNELKKAVVIRQKPVCNRNIVGYLTAESSGFDQNGFNSSLMVSGWYRSNGFYLRDDNFMEKLPMFAASRYIDHCGNWKVMSMVMKSADGADRYETEVASGKLDVFLFRTMFWTCLSHYPHMRSLNGSDGRLYINQLCFDGDTLARRKMDEYLAAGHKLTGTEQVLFDKMQALLDWVKANCHDEYNPDYKYGLYQIDEEINVKTVVGTNPDGTKKMGSKYGDLNNMVKELKALVKQYYIDNLMDTLFEYEFLK